MSSATNQTAKQEWIKKEKENIFFLKEKNSTMVQTDRMPACLTTLYNVYIWILLGVHYLLDTDLDNGNIRLEFLPALKWFLN